MDNTCSSNERATLQGLRVAITGGTSGLGLALVREWLGRVPGWPLSRAIEKMSKASHASTQYPASSAMWRKRTTSTESSCKSSAAWAGWMCW